jgi:secretion/DNA translocation related TadE-like protein
MKRPASVEARTAERGSATVWMLALSGVLATVGVAAVLVGAAVVARHRATAAADLSALAAAGRAVTGDADACASAADVARANAAELTGCTVGPDAVVEVRVSVPVRLAGLGVHRANARARAGPVAPDTASGSVLPDRRGGRSSGAVPRPLVLGDVSVVERPLGGQQLVEDDV